MTLSPASADPLAQKKPWWKSKRAFSAPGPGGEVRLWMRDVTCADTNTRAQVLSQVTRGFRRGTVTVLVDQTGTHARALFNTITGLTTPESGDVQFSKPPRPQRKSGRTGAITLILESTPVDAALTVSQNTYSALMSAGIAADLDAVSDAWSLTGLRDHLDTHPLALTQGQRVSMHIARGLALSSDIFLIDWTAFDPLSCEERRALIDMLLAVARRGATVVVSTRQLADFDRAHRAILLLNGHIYADVAPPDIAVFTALLDEIPADPTTFLGPIPQASSPTDSPETGIDTQEEHLAETTPSDPVDEPATKDRPFHFTKVSEFVPSPEEPLSPVDGSVLAPQVPPINEDEQPNPTGDPVDHLVDQARRILSDLPGSVMPDE
ncbi:ATP-binding cassette domain-containing protein [Schaalia sp. ZJ405]|uniref:ATP-binding cassette domain-containing protein n=1 Tax=Schaalia sp. ZJ405 TaxID=2709403 RepID=UPI0013E9D13C|nr:ATP-binding cassette domain-containing protein [Schaalia sp. ZJ405]QPK81169.1 ATP-binding cassette domain-containing protein [Schaalia sp. ZJ405]